MAWWPNWLRFQTPTAPAPKSPEPARDHYLDYTFSALGTVGGGLTAADVSGILEQANDGYCRLLALLLKEIQEKDPVIAAHMQTRKSAANSKPWTVTSSKYPERAQEITVMLEAADLSSTLYHMYDKIFTGYSAAAIDWVRGGGYINGFVPIAPEAIEFDLGGNPALVGVSGIKTPIANYNQYQFLYCKSMSKPGIPCRNGLGRTLVWTYLFKHSGLGGYARYVEKFGVPFLLATLPQQQWATRNQVLNTLKAMGRDGVGAIPEGTKLEVLTGANSSATDAQDRFIKYSDEVVTMAILGQLGTSAKSSGLSGGMAQDNVRYDLMADDCTSMRNTVQRQLIVPHCNMKWGGVEDVEFWINYEDEEDLNAKAVLYKMLTEITGKKIRIEDVENEFGVKFAGEDSGTAVPDQVSALIPAFVPLPVSD
jgi:phage gp29-like protein